VHHRIVCAEHGQCEATFVCTHVAQSLTDKAPRGFNWHIDDEKNFQAYCNACDAMDAATWERVRASVSTAMCVNCFQRVAKLNGVEAKR